MQTNCIGQIRPVFFISRSAGVTALKIGTKGIVTFFVLFDDCGEMVVQHGRVPCECKLMMQQTVKKDKCSGSVVWETSDSARSAGFGKCESNSPPHQYTISLMVLSRSK